MTQEEIILKILESSRNISTDVQDKGATVVFSSIMAVLSVVIIIFFLFVVIGLIKTALSNKKTIEGFIKEQDKTNKIFTAMIVDQNKSTQTAIETLTQSILDERMMSSNFWRELVTEIIKHNVYHTIVEMGILFDNNGFLSEADITLLKDNLRSIASKYRNIARQRISEMNFDNIRLENYLLLAKDAFLEYNNSVEEVITNITLEELKVDKNYRRHKQTIINRVYKFQDDLLEIIKEVLK